MLSRLQKRKAKYYFHLIDEDGNGLIEASDFALRAHRLATEQEVTGDEEREALRREVVAWWDHLCTIADFDGDARITLSEWTTYWRILQKAVEDGERTAIATLDRAARGTLRAIDQDGQGRVSQEDYACWLTAWGVAESNEAFERLDRGKKGYLTVEDVVVAVREFYLSDDPMAPGNLLYGPLPYDASGEHEDL